MNAGQHHVVVVEDDPQIRRFVRLALEAEQHAVFDADTLQRGLIEIATRKPDLVILDLGLPDGDGTTLIRELRTWSTIPVIVLSARTDETQKIAALDAGADDYLTKPFGVGELLARVRVALRRGARGADAEPVMRFGNVEVDLGLRSISKAGVPVHLTPIEYRLLAHLLAHAGKVLTQQQILKAVWGPSHVERPHYLRIYMGHLRQKLEDDPARPQFLMTETGVGYRVLV
ncbi:two-component system response regulator KdpE [Actimicrobium sp. CCC2.4]|uniref:two-component system response regulator KdpE n=1 Tax=Actimicrobium sp. CCC2.4 TaxID=3048606 RepID=UPI000204B5E5|nr:two-component system response regulator KdpE [Actimicrobium sp. CCC2.4]EGF32576.1 DNA-binding response regulator KdpE [Oxalobacteraceae bacterium IMCC9480]MEB0134125.1 two-component system response regulator KdpE [Actimicrobium sp. CCC2.4]WPX32780.1 two-component system response regulator KdpE [Actimicrobium sp. CCC2.4]